MLSMTKKLIADAMLGLEMSLSAGPKTCASSSWYENKIPEINHGEVSGASNLVELDQPNWHITEKLEYSGVSIVSKAKVVMFEPLDGNHHPLARKAMVCTAHYRLFKYPHSRVLVYTLKSLSHFLKTLNSRKKGVACGSVALLGNRVYDNANYYHFLVDVIADIWYIKCNVPESEIPDYYLVPFAGLDWQWDILNICGLSEKQVIPYDRYDLLSIEKLIIPIRDKGDINLPPWLCHAIHHICDWSLKAQGGQRLIFVSRADADRRRLVNEPAILERLCDKGFEVHTLNGLSVAEQQQLFASSAIICAPHGAALTNLVWCRPRTVVIEFLSEKHVRPCFKKLAEQNGVIYYPYVCLAVEGNEVGFRRDLYISDQQIDSVLEVVNKHMRSSDRALTTAKANATG